MLWSFSLGLPFEGATPFFMFFKLFSIKSVLDSAVSFMVLDRNDFEESKPLSTESLPLIGEMDLLG